MDIGIDIMETVEVKRLKQFGYVQRMAENRWPKEVSSERTLPNRRNKGRPKRTWEIEVKEELDRSGLLNKG